MDSWIPPINEIFKLNFNGLRINNISVSGWVIRDSNGIIKVAGSSHLGNASIIIRMCSFERWYSGCNIQWFLKLGD